jgi:phage FluMu protein Com
MIAAPGGKLRLIPLDRLRCPHCEKVLGLGLEGYYVTACPRCKRRVEFYRQGGLDTSRVVK